MGRLPRLWACVGAVLLLAGAAVAGEDKKPAQKPRTADRIDFEVSLAPEDPFADANGPKRDPATFKRGEVLTLTIRGAPRPGFHTYPFTQRSADPAQTEDFLSKLTLDDSAGLKRLWPLRETDAEFTAEKGVGVFLEHARPFTLAQDFYIPRDAAPGKKTLTFHIDLQVCSNTCVSGTHTFEVPFTVSDAAPLEDGPAERLKAVEAKPAVLDVPVRLKDQVAKGDEVAPRGDKAGPEKPPPDKPAVKPDAPAEARAPSRGSQSLGEMSLLGQLVWTMSAALAMIFTPCVFPMIPVTVSFFLKQAERKAPKSALASAAPGAVALTRRPQSAIVLALVYSGTIVVVLTAAVLLLGSVIIQLANNPWLNVGFGLLLMFFALSLFGMYEIELPSFLSRFTSSREGQGGLIGAVFMALTFTITSFTCTGPFLGVVLAPTATGKLNWPTLALLSLAYALTFAAPFFLLALFPGLLKRLPRSGGWLNSVKVVMAFIEVAAAFKFLSIADGNFGDGYPHWFTHDLVLCAWIALSLLCGVYLLGYIRLPHDTPLEYIGVPRLLLATAFIGLAVYLAPNLWRANSAGTGTVGESLASILPPDRRDLEGGNLAPGDQTRPAGDPDKGRDPGDKAEPTVRVVWLRDYEQARKQALAANKLLFIDFTGITCINCRYNEKNVFARADVQKELSRYVCVQLFTDRVPGSPNSEEEAKRNLNWQSETFGEFTLPLYVVFKPDAAAMEADGKLQGVERSRASGLITDPERFLKDVLKAPLAAQVVRAD